MRQIELLDKSKSNSGSIPTFILKDKKDIVCPYLTDCINSAIFDCNFPDEQKRLMSLLSSKSSTRHQALISDLLAYYHLPLKFMKES